MTASRAVCARHEAAHAVVAHVLGHTVDSVQVYSRPKAKRGGEELAATWHSTPRGVPYDPLRSAIISAAGYQAEGNGPPRKVRQVVGFDLMDIEKNPCLRYIDSGLRGYTLRVAAREARKLVAEHWDAIERVASAVEIAPRGKLSARRFRQVVGIEKGCAG